MDECMNLLPEVRREDHELPRLVTLLEEEEDNGDTHADLRRMEENHHGVRCQPSHDALAT